MQTQKRKTRLKISFLQWMKNKDMKLLNKIKHIFDKKTYEFQIYVNEKETILIHGLKKKQIKNKITYQFIENKIVIKFH